MSIKKDKNILEIEDDKYKERLEETQRGAKKLVSEERVPYKPALAYRAYFPNGKQIYLNGILINLIFDGRTYMLPQSLITYIDNRLENFVSKEIIKEDRFQNPKKYETEIR